jgi:hypothetical protein
MFAADGTPVVFDNSTYRVDFMTDHLLEAIDQLADDERPFYMMASYLEPHQQNDTDSYDPPKALRGKYDEATIPGDLAPMAGNWQRHYSNYLACVESLDGALGRVMAKLTEPGQPARHSGHHAQGRRHRNSSRLAWPPPAGSRCRGLAPGPPLPDLREPGRPLYPYGPLDLFRAPAR